MHSKYRLLENTRIIILTEKKCMGIVVEQVKSVSIKLITDPYYIGLNDIT